MHPEILALLIPMVAIIMGVGIAMLVIYLQYRKRKETFTLYHQERMTALEKGVELPPLPDFLLADDGRPFRPYHPRLHLLKGLTWLFVGLGAGVGIWATGGWEPALFSLILVGVGLAHLIYYFVEGKNESGATDQGQAAAVVGKP